MNDINGQHREALIEQMYPAATDFRQVANDLCEKALEDAKAQLHPLLRSVQLEHLERRNEFLQAFKNALEKRIARKFAAWQPGVQAVFRFDETRTENIEGWDGSIHLLLKVPRLSNTVKALGKALDKGLVKCLKQLGWSHFRMRQSILDIQQVTPSELRQAVSYGAMFCAVYNAPVKVWP